MKTLEARNSSGFSQRLEVVGQIAAGLAHEINTPVQYIGDNVRYVSSEIDKIIHVLKGYQNLGRLIEDDAILRERLSELRSKEEEHDLDFIVDDIPNALEQTISGVNVIAGIVGSLKALVHPGGREKTEVKVNESIEQAVTLCKGEWKKAAELELELAEDLPEVECYSGELNQVLINLIVNASHAIESSSMDGLGQIKITSFLYKSSVGIMIEDSGSGIPLEIQHRVFDPFFTSRT